MIAKLNLSYCGKILFNPSSLSLQRSCILSKSKIYLKTLGNEQTVISVKSVFVQSYLELSISYNVRQSLNFTEYRFCCAFIFYYLLFFLNLRLSLWVWINPFIKRIILIIDIKLLYHYIWTKITYLIPSTFHNILNMIVLI